MSFATSMPPPPNAPFAHPPSAQFPPVSSTPPPLTLRDFLQLLGESVAVLEGVRLLLLQLVQWGGEVSSVLRSSTFLHSILALFLRFVRFLFSPLSHMVLQRGPARCNAEPQEHRNEDYSLHLHRSQKRRERARTGGEALSGHEKSSPMLTDALQNAWTSAAEAHTSAANHAGQQADLVRWFEDEDRRQLVSKAHGKLTQDSEGTRRGKSTWKGILSNFLGLDRAGGGAAVRPGMRRQFLYVAVAFALAYRIYSLWKTYRSLLSEYKERVRHVMRRRAAAEERARRQEALEEQAREQAEATERQSRQELLYSLFQSLRTTRNSLLMSSAASSPSSSGSAVRASASGAPSSSSSLSTTPGSPRAAEFHGDGPAQTTPPDKIEHASSLFADAPYRFVVASAASAMRKGSFDACALGNGVRASSRALGGITEIVNAGEDERRKGVKETEDDEDESEDVDVESRFHVVACDELESRELKRRQRFSTHDPTQRGAEREAEETHERKEDSAKSYIRRDNTAAASDSLGHSVGSLSSNAPRMRPGERAFESRASTSASLASQGLSGASVGGILAPPPALSSVSGADISFTKSQSSASPFASSSPSLSSCLPSSPSSSSQPHSASSSSASPRRASVSAAHQTVAAGAAPSSTCGELKAASESPVVCALRFGANERRQTPAFDVNPFLALLNGDETGTFLSSRKPQCDVLAEALAGETRASQAAPGRADDSWNKRDCDGDEDRGVPSARTTTGETQEAPASSVTPHPFRPLASSAPRSELPSSTGGTFALASPISPAGSHSPASPPALHQCPSSPSSPSPLALPRAPLPSSFPLSAFLPPHSSSAPLASLPTHTPATPGVDASGGVRGERVSAALASHSPRESEEATASSSPPGGENRRTSGGNPERDLHEPVLSAPEAGRRARERAEAAAEKRPEGAVDCGEARSSSVQAAREQGGSGAFCGQNIARELSGFQETAKATWRSQQQDLSSLLSIQAPSSRGREPHKPLTRGYDGRANTRSEALRVSVYSEKDLKDAQVTGKRNAVTGRRKQPRGGRKARVSCEV
ncbi:hypothetical protein BESB_032530 [Besnoitia besnoiti]|uniref:Uncharacterized protein n=1 Tax=Besnoitia besnoiti TaxID=94643 RepID=A0A2A9M567_BESBE|nr:uncharacterized protein BESB_032530 [Besnoitia besnoiti]PFH31056.1 hypothetical protein BESB_032530 [Besnoitia besnoiti]